MVRSRKTYLAAIGVVLLIVILASLNISKILQLLAATKPLWVLLAVLTTAITIIGKGAKWRVLLFEKAERVSLFESTEFFLKGFFLSLITPGRIGDFARAVFAKERVGFIFALSSVIVDRIIDIALLLVLALLALVVFFSLSGTWIVNPFIIVVLLLFMAIGVGYAMKNRKGVFFRKLLFSLVPSKFEKQVRNGFGELMEKIKGARRKPKEILFAVLLGMVNWFFSILTGFFVGSALAIQQPYYFFAIVVLLLALIEIIPITIGGIGTREAGAILLFSVVGLNAETAVAFSLLYFTLGYGLSGMVGGILFIRKPITL